MLRTGARCRRLFSDASLSRKERRRLAAAEAAAIKVRHARTEDGLVLGKYSVKVGIEAHVQLATRRKLLSPARNEYAAPPNTRVAAADAALPGSFPRLNREAVELAVVAGLALGGDVQRVSRFDRKHYFYPDQPAGYQVTQQRAPIVRGGALGGVRLIGLHLEQDTGKTIEADGTDGGDVLVDLNRAGCALVEIVTHPDLRGAEETAVFVRRLAKSMRAAGVSGASMDLGELRCDVNVSVHPGGGRVELKNLNSVRALTRAVEHEVDRQVDLVEAGERVPSETRSWDARRGESTALRDKENEADYRFLPEPDVPAVRIEDGDLARLRARLDAALGPAGADGAADPLDEVDDETRAALEAWGAEDLLRDCAARGADPAACGRLIVKRQLHDAPGFDAPFLADLAALLARGAVSDAGVRKLRKAGRAGDESAEAAARRLGLLLLGEGDTLALVRDVLAANGEAAAKAREAGLSERAVGFLAGLCVKRAGGAVDAALARELIEKELSRG